MGIIRTALLSLALLAASLVAPISMASAAEFESERTARYVFEWEPGLAGYARQLMSRVEAHHDRIYGELGIEGTEDTRIIVLRDAERLLDEARARFDSHPPEWAAGLAYPAQRTIFVHVSDGPAELDETLQHEISHVAFGEIGPRAPRWFKEGLAIRQSEPIAMDRIWMLTEAATIGVLFRLDDLERGFPASGARAGVAYAQAVHFVGHLQNTYGPDAFRALISGLREGGLSFAEAAEQAFPDPLREIEREWLRSLKVSWGWLPVIFGSSTLWVGATVILLLAWRRRRKQKAEKLARMVAEEEALPPEDVQVAPTYIRPRPMYDPYEGRPPTIH